MVDYFIPFILLTITSFIGYNNDIIGMILSFVVMVVIFIYQIILFAKGQTIGKKLLKMQVVKRETQVPLNFFGMLIRETVGKWISGLVFSLGYIWILIDEKNQAWHDKLVDSVVVDLA